ncbi:hypothetical protein R1flu_012250 [Riccia fluitans]|uniref:Uncharacterized protein n=1 Tax=Riccia fluitans TaxID=41844 RepID=A0ABD1ZAB3_9MARC
MLAGGLTSAVKEYVRKFSGGTGKAVVMVSWAPALIKIIKHNRALLFGSLLNCAEPWEVYADYSGSYEQADVLRAIHSRKAMSKDALPKLLRLKPKKRVENAPQQPRHSLSQGRDGPRHRPRPRHERPRWRHARPERPGLLRSLTWRSCPPRSEKSKNYQAVALRSRHRGRSPGGRTAASRRRAGRCRVTGL